MSSNISRNFYKFFWEIFQNALQNFHKILKNTSTDHYTKNKLPTVIKNFRSWQNCGQGWNNLSPKSRKTSKFLKIGICSISIFFPNFLNVCNDLLILMTDKNVWGKSVSPPRSPSRSPKNSEKINLHRISTGDNNGKTRNFGTEFKNYTYRF